MGRLVNLLLVFYIISQIEARSEYPSAKYKFKILYQWKQIEYKFSNEKERSEAIANGTFDVGKVQPIDVQYAYNAKTRTERIFITAPRETKTGYPATLGIVTNEVRDGNPVIDPYPSWSWHISPESCKFYRIVSVFRVWVDECNRLWVMDTGVVGDDSVCPPQILAFDLQTDKLIHKYEVPYDQYQNKSLFIAPVAEVESAKSRCRNTWIYAADPLQPSLLVYNLKRNTSWRIEDDSFKPISKFESFNIAGTTFSNNDGIFTLAISPQTDRFRKLYYHALANNKESWVYTNYLKNVSNFMTPYKSPKGIFNTLRDARNQQSATEAIDKNGNLYFPLLIDVKLLKWNIRTPYSKENFKVAADDYKTMQFPSGLKINKYKGSITEGLWLFATAYQRFAKGSLNGNETNFRIFFTQLGM